MNRIEWLVLFLVFVAYVVIGGVIFQEIESTAEDKRRYEADLQRRQIQGLVEEKLLDGTITRREVLQTLSDYCGKPLMAPENRTQDDLDEESEAKPRHWDFYNSFFMAITVVSTIGYGNLAPTTTGSQMFCIFYALIGIPLNGLLLAGLGEYFTKTFLRAHHRYKNAPEVTGRLGLLLKVGQYLAAGICIFILMPAVVFAIAEGWSYDQAVYYAFVTLSTIGFGDYVAGYMTTYDQWKKDPSLLAVYRTFIVLWITFGLGYLAMILGFITRAMHSSRLRRLEQRVAKRFKSTHARIWHGASRDLRYVRRLLNELYMLKFKVRLQQRRQRHRHFGSGLVAANNNACRNSCSSAPLSCSPLTANVVQNSLNPLLLSPLSLSNNQLRSGSNASTLPVCDDDDIPLYYLQPVYRHSIAHPAFVRERSNSLPGKLPSLDQNGDLVLQGRSLSESCLDMIDRGATFAAAPRRVDTSELLATVVDAIASAAASEHAEEELGDELEFSSEEEREEEGYHGFSDAEILATEGHPRPSITRGSLRSRASSLAQSLRSGARSRAGSIVGSIASSFSRDHAAADNGDRPSPTRHKGGSPVSLRRALAMKVAAAHEMPSDGSGGAGSGSGVPSGASTPVLRRFERRQVSRDPLARRRSDGAVLVSQRARMGSLAVPRTSTGLQQLDDTTIGDLLRALHSLHSRMEPTPLRMEPSVVPPEVSNLRRGSRILHEESLRSISRRGSRLDSVGSASHSVSSSPKNQPKRMAQRLLERLENGVPKKTTPDPELGIKGVKPEGAGVSGRAEVVRRSSRTRRDTLRAQHDDVIPEEEPSSSRATSPVAQRSELPIRDVLTMEQERAKTPSRAKEPSPPKAKKKSPPKPPKGKKSAAPAALPKKEGSDSDSEGTVYVSRL